MCLILRLSSGFWDLVDIDAQGAEHGMLRDMAQWLASRVGRLHVSTHRRLCHQMGLGGCPHLQAMVTVGYCWMTHILYSYIYKYLYIFIL